MKRMAVLASALMVAAATMLSAPQAEARRGHGIAAGLIVGAVVGGVIAASIASQRRHYAYYPRRVHYGYYRPAYHRPIYHYHRPLRVYRAGFTRGWGGHRHYGYHRSWRGHWGHRGLGHHRGWRHRW